VLTPDPTNEPLNVILSPHFDDAVLSLGGLIATAPERSIVVTVFAGTPAEGAVGRWDRRSGFKTASEAIRARALENKTALASLGVLPSGIVDLDFLDRQYRPESEIVIGSLQAAIGETVRQIAESHGAPVNVFSPASPWHPDHRLVTDAVVALWRTRALHGAGMLLYQDQPYAYLELRRRTLAPLRFASFDAGNARGVPAQPHWLEFDDAAAAKKRRAIGHYRSQFPLVRPLLRKMIEDFSRHQTRKAGLASRHAELAYRLDAPLHS
jgi:LmbE family N-acetylglucosaminyl deacetylase